VHVGVEMDGWGTLLAMVKGKVYAMNPYQLIFASHTLLPNLVFFSFYT
jgi:hypothetical protein